MDRKNQPCGLLLVAVMVLFSQPARGDDVENAQRVCSVYEAMGANMTCSIAASDHAVDLLIDATEAEAAATCPGLASSMVHLAQMFSRKWKLRIFTPASADEPLAVCELG